jgi:hypothetical protein
MNTHFADLNLFISLHLQGTHLQRWIAPSTSVSTQLEVLQHPGVAHLRTFLHHQHKQLHVIRNLHHTVHIPHHDDPLLHIYRKVMIFLDLILMGMRMMERMLPYPPTIHHLTTLSVRITFKIVALVKNVILEQVFPHRICIRLLESLSGLSSQIAPLAVLVELASVPKPHPKGK